MREPTLGEMQVKFEAHEQRDVDRFETTINQMKEGFGDVVTKLDEIKEGLTVRVDDHEARLRKLENDFLQFKTRVMTWGSVAMIVLGAVEFALQIYFK